MTRNQPIVNETLLGQLNLQLNEAGASARRLFHGRGKKFPGLETLNIDWYPPYVLVNNFGENLDDSVMRTLHCFFDAQSQISAVLHQLRGHPGQRTEILYQRQMLSLPLQQWTALSDRVVCETSLGKNRNTGVFLDMRAGWHWLAQNAENKRVLNLFCYTGIFSMFALSGGAARVDNVDMAANVIKVAQRNHRKNGFSDKRCAFYKRDILKSGRWLEGRPRYDLIIIDPPPYHKKAFSGWQDYRTLLTQCRAALAENGTILTALNNPQVSLEQFSQDLEAMFPDARQLNSIARAPEISERDDSKGLKTVAVAF